MSVIASRHELVDNEPCITPDWYGRSFSYNNVIRKLWRVYVCERAWAPFSLFFVSLFHIPLFFFFYSLHKWSTFHRFSTSPIVSFFSPFLWVCECVSFVKERNELINSFNCISRLSQDFPTPTLEISSEICSFPFIYAEIEMFT